MKGFNLLIDIQSIIRNDIEMNLPRFMICTELLKLLRMSILFIGQRERFHKPRLTILGESEEVKQAKRIQKQQYRNQLVGQMNDNYLRRKFQKIREKEQQLHYQKMFYQQIHPAYHNPEISRKEVPLMQRSCVLDQPSVRKQPLFAPADIRSNYRYRNQEDSYSMSPKYESTVDQSYRTPHYLPPISNSRINQFPMENSRFKQAIRERLKTQADTLPTRAHFIEPIPDDFSLTRGVRQRQLKEELQRKLNEVYDVMSFSVQSFNTEEDLDRINNKIKYLGALNGGTAHNKSTMRKKKPDYSIPSEQNQFYRLPNTSKRGAIQGYAPEQQEMEWNEWYLRNKIKELQEEQNLNQRID